MFLDIFLIFFEENYNLEIKWEISIVGVMGSIGYIINKIKICLK